VDAVQSDDRPNQNRPLAHPPPWTEYQMHKPDPKTDEVWTTECHGTWQVLCQCSTAGVGGRDTLVRLWNLTRVDGESGLRTVSKGALYAGYVRRS
jgi:hypothetical protein